MVNRLLSIKVPSLSRVAKYFTLYNDSEFNYSDRTSLKQSEAHGRFQLSRQCKSTVYKIEINKSSKIIASTVDNISEIIRFHKIV